MPRDKSQSQARVLEAAKTEFLEKGFEKASIRDIGKRAGMTSAGLYRHCKDKEDLFRQVLEPLLQEMSVMMKEHRNNANKAVESGIGIRDSFHTGEVQIFRELSKAYRPEMKLLLCRSEGTAYENFIHKNVLEQQKEMLQVIDTLKRRGVPVKPITEKDMHILLSAYLTALIEPIVHDYSEEETDMCLNKISDFFMPGWMNILGLTEYARDCDK